jgi:hypothetical protein
MLLLCGKKKWFTNLFVGSCERDLERVAGASHVNSLSSNQQARDGVNHYEGVSFVVDEFAKLIDLAIKCGGVET